MSKPAENLSPSGDIGCAQCPAGQPDDPAEFRAMFAELQAENTQIAAENAKMSATLRVQAQPVRPA